VAQKNQFGEVSSYYNEKKKGGANANDIVGPVKRISDFLMYGDV